MGSVQAAVHSRSWLYCSPPVVSQESASGVKFLIAIECSPQNCKLALERVFQGVWQRLATRGRGKHRRHQGLFRAGRTCLHFQIKTPAQRHADPNRLEYKLAALKGVALRQKLVPLLDSTSSCRTALSRPDMEVLIPKSQGCSEQGNCPGRVSSSQHRAPTVARNLLVAAI